MKSKLKQWCSSIPPI